MILFPFCKFLIQQKKSILMDKTKMIAEKYIIHKRIGSGLTSVVYQANTKQKEVVCVKVIEDSFYRTVLGKKLIDNEIALLEQITHENILKIIEKQNYQGKWVIITEFCDQGDLFQKMKKEKMQQQEVLTIIQQIIEACIYLQTKNIVHRDLKPENIFFKDKILKIADFGFAVKESDPELMKIDVGSPLYMAPESLKCKQFSSQTDIFALGVIWYELLTGKTPWSAVSEKQLLQKINTTLPQMKAVKSDKQIIEIIKRCLHKNSKERPTFHQLKKIVQKKILGNANSIKNKVVKHEKSVFDLEGEKQNMMIKKVMTKAKAISVVQKTKISKVEEQFLKKDEKKKISGKQNKKGYQLDSKLKYGFSSELKKRFSYLQSCREEARLSNSIRYDYYPTLGREISYLRNDSYFI